MLLEKLSDFDFFLFFVRINFFVKNFLLYKIAAITQN